MNAVVKGRTHSKLQVLEKANGREGSAEKRNHAEGADLTGVVPFKVRSCRRSCRNAVLVIHARNAGSPFILKGGPSPFSKKNAVHELG